MNLPNKLTVFRVILIIPFVILLLGGYAQWGWFTALFGGILGITDYIALVIFIIASLTDLLDGKIARKYNLVTNFGKFMDPLADKLLVCSAMICLIEMGRIPAWVVIIIISREFIISGFRLVAANDNDNVRTYRYGGDEFIMIIPDGTEDDALSFINRWNKLMEPIQKDSKIPISASVGYSCGRYADINEIICEADEKMYENKRVRRE